MPCTEYERLHQKGVDAMIAEDRARMAPFRSMAESARLELRDSAHTKVMMAELLLNNHIATCDECKRDGHTPVNFTVGQF
jgi:hypothetical protein